MSEHFLTPSCSNENYLLSKECKTSQGKPLLAIIYAGQNHVVFTIYTTPDLKYLLSTKQSIQTYTPQKGWYEQDPEEIMQVIYNCCRRGCCELLSLGYDTKDIAAIGVTNQRETVVAWNADTGKSFYPAIVKNDTRATKIAERIVSFLPGRDQNYFKPISGLPVLPNFPALKVLWLQENILSVRNAIKDGNCKIGTLDSWIVWNLTNGNLHVTDVTNASYTFLMNINTLKWDSELLKTFSIRRDILPEIYCSSEIFGFITEPSCVLQNKRIAGITADQQALLLGQMCFQRGRISVDLSSDCCLLCNIQNKCCYPKDATTTVAYKLDSDSSCMYALEGIILGSGKILEWLNQKLRILPDVSYAEKFAGAVRTTNNVYFVPAFSGPHAPYWRKDARGILVGLTDKTNRLHVVRAALESVCFQIYDIIESMRNTGEVRQDVVYASGPDASNELLMQILADILGVMVVRFKTDDLISYGAAICAGHKMEAVDMKHIKQGIWRKSIDFMAFIPRTRKEQQIHRYTKWRSAVTQCVNKMNLKIKHTLDADNDNFLVNGPLTSVLLITSIIYVIHLF